MTVERGQVQAKEFTRNGKPKVKIGGSWYFAGRCDVSNLNAGQSIEFDWSEFGEERNGRRPRGLNNWALLPAGTQVPQASGHASDEPMSEPKRMFVSNVASAVLHGTGATTDDIRRVIEAVASAYDGLSRRQPPAQTPRPAAPANGHSGYEPPPGFYDDAPPPEEPQRGTRTW